MIIFKNTYKCFDRIFNVEFIQNKILPKFLNIEINHPISYKKRLKLDIYDCF